MVPFTRQLFFWVLLLLLLPAPLQAGLSDQNDRDQINLTFNNFITALLAKDGKGIVDCLSTKFSQYYIRERSTPFIVDPASSSPTADLIVNRALVTKLAAITDQSPTLDAFVQNILAKGNRPVPSSLPLQLSNIVINGDTATATLEINGNPAPFQLSFVREAVRWKIDPLGMLQYWQLFITFDQMRKGRSNDQEVQTWVDRLPYISSTDLTPPAPGGSPLPTSPSPVPTSTPPSGPPPPHEGGL